MDTYTCISLESDKVFFVLKKCSLDFDPFTKQANYSFSITMLICVTSEQKNIQNNDFVIGIGIRNNNKFINRKILIYSNSN